MVTSQVSFSAFASACALASVQTARTGVAALPIQLTLQVAEQGIPASSLPGDAVEVSTPPVESSPLPSLEAGPVPRSSVGGGECPAHLWRRRAALVHARYERPPFRVVRRPDLGDGDSCGPDAVVFSGHARAVNYARRFGLAVLEV